MWETGHGLCACTSFSEGIIDCTGAQTLLYLTCTMISSVDLAHYGVSRANDWVSVDCGTRICYPTDTDAVFRKANLFPVGMLARETEVYSD